jgi:hypothetical protein
MYPQTTSFAADAQQFPTNAGEEIPSPQPRRPLLVWVIALWLIVGSLFALVSLYAVYSGRIVLPPGYARTTFQGHVIAQTVAFIVASLWAGVAFFRLRQVAFTLAATLAALHTVGMLVLLAQGNMPGSGVDGTAIAQATLSTIVWAAISVYAWKLKQRGVLR